MNRIILPMMGFKTVVLMKSPLGKHIKLNGGIILGVRKKLDCNVRILHSHVVYGIHHHRGYV